MKNNLKAGLIAGLVLILVIGACGCVGSNPTPTPTAAPTVAPTVTTTPTVKPTAVTSTDSNIRGIEANLVSTNNGPAYTIVTHFTKTTVGGKTAYTGVVKDEDGYVFKVTAILTSSQSEASTLADSTIAGYKAQGYTVKEDLGNHRVIMTKGDSMIGVSGYSEIYGTGSPGVGILEAEA
jgi:hypothetical protein